MVVSKVLFSSKSEEWHTPKKLYQELYNEFHFDLDPCTTADNPLNTPFYYTKKEDGLKQKWDDASSAFVNPPYNHAINNWLEKAVKELDRLDNSLSVVVFLLPARTDTKWFHKYIYDIDNKDYRKYVNEIRFLKGRLRFGDSKNSAPFPSMIVVFR